MRHHQNGHRIIFFIILFYMHAESTIVFAQQGSGPFSVKGYSNVFIQLSDRNGYQTDVPENLIRWNLNSTLSYLDLPLNVSLFLTTEREGLRQSPERYTISFRPGDVLRKKIRDKYPTTFLPRFLSLFPVIEAGNCRPVYSALMMQGITLSDGVNIEFAPGKFILAFSCGRSSKAVQSPDPFYQAFGRKIIAGRIGFGGLQKQFLVFSYFKATDDGNSIDPVPVARIIPPDTLVFQSDSFFHIQDTIPVSITPMENHVVSGAFRFALLKEKLFMNGEIASSLTTEDINAMGLEAYAVSDWVPSWITINTSSRLDYAWMLGSEYKSSKTSLKADVRRIGPGFYSAGLPYQRNDILMYHITADQACWQRKLALSIMFKGTSDNLLGQKKSTTTTSQYGLTLTMRIPKVPWFSVMYMPVIQQNDIPDARSFHEASMVSFNTGYPYLIRGKATANSGINIQVQRASTELAGLKSTIGNYQYLFRQHFMFGRRAGINVSAGYNELIRKDQRQSFYQFSLGNDFTLFEKARNSAGLTFFREIGGSMTRWRGWIRSGFKVNKHSELALSLDNNQCTNVSADIAEASELVFRLNYMIRW